MFKQISSIIIIIIALLSFVAAQDTNQRDCLYYFYGKDCTGCQSSNQYIQDLHTKYPQVEIKSYEVYHNQQNKALFESYANAYNIAQDAQGIPAVITHSSYFIGQKAIATFLEKYIQDNEEITCPSLESTNMVGILGDKNPQNVLQVIPNSVLRSSAIKDSFRPIMFILIIILALCIISIHDYKKTILGSILFIIASYTAFLLYGTNNSSGFAGQHGFILAISIISIIIALLKIGIFFLYNNDPFANLEREDRLKIEKAKAIASHPAWFFLFGYIATLFAFTNLHKNFELLRTLHLEGAVTSIVTPKIIMYFIILMLPLVTVAVVMNLIKIKLEQRSKSAAYSDRHLGQWKLHNHRVFNVVVSILVIAISLLLIYA